MNQNDKLKLVAEYDGYIVYDKRFPRNHGIGGGIMESPKEIILQKVKYHISFDALIPAAIKIVTNERRCLKWSSIQERRDKERVCIIDIENAAKTMDIGVLFNSVVDAIILINQYKNINP